MAGLIRVAYRYSPVGRDDERKVASGVFANATLIAEKPYSSARHFLAIPFGLLGNYRRAGARQLGWDGWSRSGRRLIFLIMAVARGEAGSHRH